GGCLGCAMGMLADGWTASSIVGSSQGGGKFVVLKLAVDYQILSAGLAVSVTMGLLGGLIPALNAMRLTALDALR
ncbi:MAG: ABC transporter permease, partial [Planctomycetaceae bacterium]|nr:ABC transporter permease [Planctomycetaceae bacterium]